MNLNVLIKQLRGGFRPFVIRLTDGLSFSIPHSEFIAVGRHAVVVVDKEGDPGISIRCALSPLTRNPQKRTAARLDADTGIGAWLGPLKGKIWNVGLL